MVTLNEREKYCLALIITRGGEASYEEIRDTILESKESFEDLSDRYLKYHAVKRTLLTLRNKGYLSEQKSEIFKVNPVMITGFIQQYPIAISKGIKTNIRYRKEHTLEFDTSEIEEMLLDDEYMEKTFKSPPYDLMENLKEALKLQKMGSFDSVLVKCGKCVESIVDELNHDYSLFDKQLRTGRMINRLRHEDTFDKITEKRLSEDDFRTFVDGVSVVYRFRNTMGAHSGMEWGIDQVSTSCLILAFYLVDFYMWNIRKEE